MHAAMAAHARTRRMLLLFLVPSALTAGTDTDARVHQLCSRFIAPCCWHENLGVHYSPLAAELRTEIRKRVAAGETDDQIKRDLVRRFTPRVLAEPEGVAGQWLSWAPWIVSTVGMFAVSWVIWRSAARLQPSVPAAPAIHIPDSDWE